MPTTSKPCILSVDDLPTNQRLLKTIFKKDYEFIAVGNGLECIDTLKDRLPDIILMDAEMPVMDGYEACQIIKENPQTANLKIIMLSSHASKAHIEDGLQAGADLYISKPYSIAELKEAVQDIIKTNQKALTAEPITPIITQLAKSIYHIVLDDIKSDCVFCNGTLHNLISEHNIPECSALIVEPTTNNSNHACKPKADTIKHFSSIAYILTGDGNTFTRHVPHAIIIKEVHKNSVMFANYEDAYNWSATTLAATNN